MMKKTGVKKSRWTVPLNVYSSLVASVVDTKLWRVDCIKLRSNMIKHTFEINK
jgi:hypothetical protein